MKDEGELPGGPAAETLLKYGEYRNRKQHGFFYPILSEKRCVTPLLS